MEHRARELHERANELERADFRYTNLVRYLGEFFDGLAGSEYGQRISRNVLAQVEQT